MKGKILFVEKSTDAFIDLLIVLTNKYGRNELFGPIFQWTLSANDHSKDVFIQ